MVRTTSSRKQPSTHARLYIADARQNDVTAPLMEALRETSASALWSLALYSISRISPSSGSWTEYYSDNSNRHHTTNSAVSGCCVLRFSIEAEDPLKKFKFNWICRRYRSDYNQNVALFCHLYDDAANARANLLRLHAHAAAESMGMFMSSSSCSHI